jgi:hypothetical protein
LGSTEFRTKRIPPPIVKFSGKPGGTISAAEAKVQNRIFAILEDFDFDAPFTQTPGPLFAIQTDTCKAISLNLALDPHEDFGIDSLWASISTEQTTGNSCE